MTGRNPFAIILLTIGLLFTSCEFRELVDPGNTHYARVYIDEDIMNVTGGFYDESREKPEYRRPEVIHLTLCDPETGKMVAERYLRNQGDDEYGHYYDGYIICEPGEYSMLAWNFDTEATIVDSESSRTEARAYTNEIASHIRASLASLKSGASQYSGARIVYEPDHLFVAECASVKIPYGNAIDTLRTPEGSYFRAESIVESWYIQIRIKGMRFVSESASLLSGMSGSKLLYNGRQDDDDPVVIYFGNKSTEIDPTGEQESILYATFSTFGKIPEAGNEWKLSFDFHTTYGTGVSATIDIADEFHKPDALEHRWIIIDKLITIPDPPKGESGGFSPGVDEWGDVVTELII